MRAKSESARTAALAMLSRKQYTTWELKNKLRSSGFDFEEIQCILAELEEKKILNDYDYAVRYSEMKRRSSHLGRRLLSAKLKAKGVCSEIILQAVEEGHSDTEEYCLAEAALAKRLTQWQIKAGEDREKLLRQASGFLLRRGFSERTVMKLISDTFDVAE